LSGHYYTFSICGKIFALFFLGGLLLEKH